MKRTYVVTGAASGIGAATKRYVQERGGRVITCDLRDADVIADLTSPVGRAALVDGVTRLSEGHIDAIVANAGGGPTPKRAPPSTFSGPWPNSRACARFLTTVPRRVRWRFLQSPRCGLQWPHLSKLVSIWTKLRQLPPRVTGSLRESTCR